MQWSGNGIRAASRAERRVRARCTRPARAGGVRAAPEHVRASAVPTSRRSPRRRPPWRMPRRPPDPPARLRADILRRAARGPAGAVVLPFRRRRVEAGALGRPCRRGRGGDRARDLGGQPAREARPAALASAHAEQAVAILGDPQASRRPLTGAGGAARRRLATAAACSSCTRLAAAPKGKTYEAWVIEGGVPKPAGLFSSGHVVLLTRPVTRGARSRGHRRARRRLAAADAASRSRRARRSRALSRRAEPPSGTRLPTARRRYLSSWSLGRRSALRPRPRGSSTPPATLAS